MHESLPWATVVWQWRTETELTQAQAARVCNVNERTWRRWENGESSPSEQKAAGYLKLMIRRRADAHTERRQRK